MRQLNWHLKKGIKQCKKSIYLTFLRYVETKAHATEPSTTLTKQTSSQKQFQYSVISYAKQHMFNRKNMALYIIWLNN